MNAKSGGFLIGLAVVLVAVMLAAIGSGPSQRNAAASNARGTTSVPVVTPVAMERIPQPLATWTSEAPPTRVPSRPPTAEPVATSGAPKAVTATPAAFDQPPSAARRVIGQSVEGRPLFAYRIGDGPLKVVVVGNVHGAFEENTHALVQRLLAHFEEQPEEVPAGVSLWFVPTLNPDGLQTGHRWNANDVDLNRNADTDLDGCAANDWSPDTLGYEGPHPGAGGAYPFSEPESRAIRDLASDAWAVVFYHSAADAIFVDTCQRHVPTMRLAEVLSQGTGYPVPQEGWAGYPVTGDLADYLAGEGVAAVTVELADHEDPEFERNLAGLRALLANVDGIVTAEADAVGAEYRWLDEQNTGGWHLAPGSLPHPLALELLGNVAYLLDGGRVLALDLTQPAAPAQLLAPGDNVDGVRVLEPLDLAVGGTSLLVLDRAGDVYGYDPEEQQWAVVRYDRPAGSTYDHYFVALAAASSAVAVQPSSVGYLLETTHEQVWRFPVGEKGVAWFGLPQSRDVDLGAVNDDLYLLTRATNSPMGQLIYYRNGRQVATFRPNVELMHPRQVVATSSAVYVLDRAGRRLLALDPQSGVLRKMYQFRDRQAISAMWADPAGERLLLAGRNVLYFVGEPERSAQIGGEGALTGPQPHDPAWLEGLRGLAVPISGAAITSRDFQMPGAPRHYRLGVHEGMDFYGHTVGVNVDRSTPVRATAAGVIVRSLVDYVPLTAAQADDWAARSRSLGYTPPEVLDGYRGMQVWIDHGGGLVSRYAHLGAIAPGIIPGARVESGQVIGTVGNSGTPASVSSQTTDVHLHYELWLYDQYVGQFLRPIEAREWLEKVVR